MSRMSSPGPGGPDRGRGGTRPVARARGTPVPRVGGGGRQIFGSPVGPGASVPHQGTTSTGHVGAPARGAPPTRGGLGPSGVRPTGPPRLPYNAHQDRGGQLPPGNRQPGPAAPRGPLPAGPIGTAAGASAQSQEAVYSGFRMLQPDPDKRSSILQKAHEEEMKLDAYRESHKMKTINEPPKNLGGNISIAESRQRLFRDHFQAPARRREEKESWKLEQKEADEREYEEKKARARQQSEKNDDRRRTEEREQAARLDGKRKRVNENFLRRQENLANAQEPGAGCSRGGDTQTADEVDTGSRDERRNEQSEDELIDTVCVLQPHMSRDDVQQLFALMDGNIDKVMGLLESRWK